jgi:hypothetical protein
MRAVRPAGNRDVNRRRLALGWGTLLSALLAWQTAVRASRPDGIDLTSYLLSARAMMHGASPYLLPTPFPYLYPPTLAFLLVPLALVPPFAALVIWFALNAGAALWAIRRVVLSVRRDLADRPADIHVFLAVFCTFFFTIFQSNLRNGQVNFLVLALCVAAALPRPARPGSPVPPAPPASPPLPAPPALPALFWSLAIAVKIFPLVLLPYFALRRRARWMICAVAACAACLLVPALTAGGQIIDIYRQYSNALLVSSVASRPEALDFSLAGTIATLSGAALTPALRLSAAAVVLGWILQADGRRLRGEHARPLALYLLAIPLASPKSEVHHLAFVLPAAAVIAARWCWSPALSGRAFTMAATAAALLYLVATMAPQPKGLLYSAAAIAAGVALTKSGGNGGSRRKRPNTEEQRNGDHNGKNSRAAVDH